ncbi:MAG: hypothetical protein GXP25_16225 [Planctomycetes bacterium]|nr:hypothetical protein [Planctomycetota bacterium]
MNGRWQVVPAAAIGLLAGLAAGYCELMIRYHETGLALGQFPFLLASRAVLGAAIGVLVVFRERISLPKAVAIAALAVLGLAEALNWVLFVGA